MVEEQLIDLIEALYWLYHCWKKFYLDLWKYSFGFEDGFEITTKGLKIGFRSHPRGSRDHFNQNGWIMVDT